MTWSDLLLSNTFFNILNHLWKSAFPSAFRKIIRIIAAEIERMKNDDHNNRLR